MTSKHRRRPNWPDAQHRDRQFRDHFSGIGFPFSFRPRRSLAYVTAVVAVMSSTRHRSTSRSTSVKFSALPLEFKAPYRSSSITGTGRRNVAPVGAREECGRDWQGERWRRSCRARCYGSKLNFSRSCITVARGWNANIIAPQGSKSGQISHVSPVKKRLK